MLRLEKQPIMAAIVACAVLAALTTTAAAQNLQLNVSPFSGAVSVQNTSVSPVSLDGYQINSVAGQLVPDPTNTSGVGWDSLTDAGLPGWAEYAPSATALSELNLISAKSIPAGGTVSLGTVFTAYGTKDVTWGYSVATGGTSVSSSPGALHYGGGATLEVITLRGAGNSIDSIPMILHNVESQVGVTFDAYVIQSASGSLNPAGFNGFAGHGVAGWGSFAPSANALSELTLTTTPTMAAGRYQPLGSAFVVSGGTKDLTLDIHVIGAGFGDAPFQGDVVYRDELAGDANGDKVVNIFDINLISSNWNTAGLPGDTNYDGIVNIFDINYVSSHWGNTLPGGGAGSGSVTAVPEPGTLTLFSLGLLAACCRTVKRWSRERV